jgi:hypothetical protein
MGRFIGHSADDYDPAPPAVVLGTTPPTVTMTEAELPHLDESTLDTEYMVRRLIEPGMSSMYRAAQPFPHIVVEHVLPTDVFCRAVREFPAIDDPAWNGYVHVNETKYANADVNRWGPTLRSIAQTLTSSEFVGALSELTGFEGLVADWTMDGGGLHQTLRGGHLNIHTDFTTHHRDPRLCRRVNLLLYLNDIWRTDWGGALELWDGRVKRPVRCIEPIGNRMLVFTTSGRAFHGHPDPLHCPEDVARRSLALYYFTVEDRPLRRATAYKARPGDGTQRISIWADRQGLAVYDAVKRRFGMSDRAVHAAMNRIDLLRRRWRP